MKVIICLDDNNGMLFNNRRQSRDSAVLEDAFVDLGNTTLNALEFSQKLLSPYGERVSICTALEAGKVYFIENIDLKPYESQIKEIIVYRWNRIYPADFYCEIDFSAFNVISQAELVGSSHEKITKIIYSR